MGKKMKHKHTIAFFAAALFWLLVWQGLSILVQSQLLLPSPMQVALTLGGLVQQGDFWQSVLYSILRVMGGIGCGVVCGVFLAVVCARWNVIQVLLAPLLAAVKAVPVASFIILAILWLHTTFVPALIAFLIVAPLVLSNVLTGIQNTPQELLEMAEVYRFSLWKKLRAIYIPHCMSYFHAACMTGIGLGWKSAVAAEVITRPKFGVGDRLFEAKMYLEVPEMFAWTVAVVVLSVAVEQLYRFGMRQTVWAKRGLLKDVHSFGAGE